jgi:hypothetical protein
VSPDIIRPTPIGPVDPTGTANSVGPDDTTSNSVTVNNLFSGTPETQKINNGSFEN